MRTKLFLLACLAVFAAFILSCATAAAIADPIVAGAIKDVTKSKDTDKPSASSSSSAETTPAVQNSNNNNNNSYQNGNVNSNNVTNTNSNNVTNVTNNITVMQNTPTPIQATVSDSASLNSGTFTDSRGNITYKYVKIGNKVWMAENLKHAAGGSKCNFNEEANCDEYGRLYTWEAAMKAYPNGWHLPNKSEWDDLSEAVGGEKIAGKKLKSKSGWSDSGNGTDDYGFAALPGGLDRSDGGFYDIGH